jgi:tetratricopeptide (TPR) repeat protein
MLIAAGMHLCAAGVVDCLAGTVEKGTVWETRENLANRFGAEWYKLGALDHELSGIAEALTDVRDIELFPPALTGLDKAKIIGFDKRIERMEQAHAQLKAGLQELRPTLLDAMAILREMVVGGPVESMFDVLEQGDLKRAAGILGIKRATDSLWMGVDTLIGSVERSAGVKTENIRGPQDGFDEEFSTILQANLGRQSERYSRKLTALKDSLVGRGSPSDQREMFSVEVFRVKKYMKENKPRLAQQKIEGLTARFKGKVAMDDLSMLEARIAMSLGDFGAALTAMAGPPAGEVAGNDSRALLRQLYRMQSLYALHYYDTAWREGGTIEFTRFTGASRNLLLWITMESGLALGRKDSYVKFASYIDRKAPYAIHVMHALGQSYAASGDLSMALSVFESAAKFTVKSDMDRIAARELEFAIAGADYELGRYEKALPVFYDLMNDNACFDRALYGILWCYLQLGSNDKAEITLRKLINQSPESSYAADAFLLFAKRCLYKAQYEWKKVGYLTKEETRLKELAAKLEEKRKADTSAGRDTLYKGAGKELALLLSRLKTEPRATYDSIAARYGAIQRICALINGYYATGSFQKVVFTEKREQLLHYLDSVMLAAKGPAANAPAGTASGVSNRRQELTAIKAIVARANDFSAESYLERYRFDRDYITWQKEQLNYYEQTAIRPFGKRTDSTSLASVSSLKGHYSHLLDSLLSIEDTLKQRSTGSLKAKLQRIIAEGGCDSADLAFFKYHLGELFYDEENTRFTQEYNRYEKARAEYERQLADYRENKLQELPVEPKPPKIDHSASLAAFQAVLAVAPPSAPDCIAAAHYSIAWCWNDAAVFDSALAHMQTVATLFPKSAYAPQAWLYSGEYMFDKGNLPKAIQCYQAVMKYPESEWFDEALYKLAWSQYRLSNPEKAISSFLALVELGGGKSKGMQMLEKESMDYIAISFSEADMTGEKGT